MFSRREAWFTSAKIKLTAWYLLIIMLVSSIFSILIYKQINDDYTRFEQFQINRQETVRPGYEAVRRQLEIQGFDAPPMPVYYDPQVFQDARVRLQAILLLINLGILSLAGVAGYFLAGRTLKPIKVMVDDQNRFITDASHELRTPLTALKTSIEVGLRDPKITKQDAMDLLESNLEEVNGLQYLSDNLIKLTQNKQTNGLTFAEVSIADISAEAVKKVVKLAKHKNISVIDQVVEANLMGDRQSLIELLVIFLENAIKYSEPKTAVTLTSVNSDRFIDLKISDQGQGIDPKDIPHLFDRFYRADKSRSQTPGYGLGLSIAKKIIDNHHGQVFVESTLGKGTEFKIRLLIKH